MIAAASASQIEQAYEPGIGSALDTFPTLVCAVGNYGREISEYIDHALRGGRRDPLTDSGTTSSPKVPSYRKASAAAEYFGSDRSPARFAILQPFQN